MLEKHRQNDSTGGKAAFSKHMPCQAFSLGANMIKMVKALLKIIQDQVVPEKTDSNAFD